MLLVEAYTHINVVIITLLVEAFRHINVVMIRWRRWKYIKDSYAGYGADMACRIVDTLNVSGSGSVNHIRNLRLKRNYIWNAIAKV